MRTQTQDMKIELGEGDRNVEEKPNWDDAENNSVSQMKGSVESLTKDGVENRVWGRKKRQRNQIV